MKIQLLTDQPMTSNQQAEYLTELSTVDLYILASE